MSTGVLLRPARQTGLSGRSQTTLYLKKSNVIPDSCAGVIVGLTRRLHQFVSDVDSSSLRSATQRVICYLLCPATTQENNAATAIVSLPARKTLIASRSNITPEHFSRVVREPAESRLLEVDSKNSGFSMWNNCAHMTSELGIGR